MKCNYKYEYNLLQIQTDREFLEMGLFVPVMDINVLLCTGNQASK